MKKEHKESVNQFRTTNLLQRLAYDLDRTSMSRELSRREARREKKGGGGQRRKRKQSERATPPPASEGELRNPIPSLAPKGGKMPEAGCARTLWAKARLQKPPSTSSWTNQASSTHTHTRAILLTTRTSDKSPSIQVILPPLGPRFAPFVHHVAGTE